MTAPWQMPHPPTRIRHGAALSAGAAPVAGAGFEYLEIEEGGA